MHNLFIGSVWISKQNIFFSVPEKSSGVWRQIATFFLKSSGCTWFMSTPPNFITPLLAEISPDILLRRVVLPEPILPSKATFSPGLIVKLSQIKDVFVASGYNSSAFLKI